MSIGAGCQVRLRRMPLNRESSSTGRGPATQSDMPSRTLRNHTTPRRITFVASVSCLILIALGCGQDDTDKPPQATLYDTEVRSLTSSFAEQDYRLLVALPRGYAESERRYPVLYVLDADVFFGTITETARLLPLESIFLGHQSVPDLILVGIAYPGGFDEMSQKRGRDFTPTAEFDADPDLEPDGAARFFSFLKEQAIPFVDDTYRTRPGHRTLLGTSAGGLFVLDTLLRHPGTFHRYIATSPRMDDILFRHETAYADQHPNLNAVLYLSAGTEGEIERQIADGVERFHAILTVRNYPDLRLVHESLKGENHVSAQPTAFTHGLKAVFGKPVVAEASGEQ